MITSKQLNILERELKKINPLYEVKYDTEDGIITFKIPTSQEVLSSDISEVLRKVFNGYKINILSYSLLSRSNFIDYEVVKI